MHAENFFTAANIRKWNHNAAIEASRTQQGGIKNVRPVGCGDQDHAFIRFKTVHFDQQLVQRLLTLVVSTAKTGTAVTAYGIDFIDKDDAGSVLLALLEEITYAACSDADEHFYEIGT